ncbi:pilus assembly protein PilM [Patescibacteria group bacterium]|nr:pilus assembly protein PilM [Patescibacteria group bacterium]MBU2158603.1 pilus assembly protein PilM [Patescibacteria group bacterium]
MSHALSRLARIEFAPPKYLAFPTAGIDISASGVKVALLEEHVHGLELSAYGEERLQPGAVVDGEIRDTKAVVAAVRALTKKHGIKFAHIALSESRSYLFEATVAGRTKASWRTAIESRLDEYVPLPPAEVAFDVAATGPIGEKTHVVGVGYARRVIEESLNALDGAGIEVRSIESETFAVPRAMMPNGDQETVLIIDIGRTTTKLVVVSRGVPRFATTLDIGGHALTLAVQKHFGVTEDEAKRVKAERGLVSGDANDEYLSAMLSTVSAIREEIVHRLEYWQTHAASTSNNEQVTRAILVGGNATVRGLPEYLETTLKIPVELGDVFTNLAPREHWLPPLDYFESLAYSTAIGLALRDYAD